MEYATLGRTGVQVSRYCMGAMSFGASGNTDHDECVRITHAALDAGINFVDTADIYSAGEAEEIVGKALAGRRDDVVLATKCFWPMGPGVNQRGLSRRWITRAVEDSLRRLQTDRIDLYQLHKPDWSADLEDSLAAATDLVRQGKVLMVGISTYPAEWIVEAQWAARRRQLERVATEQPPYSILVRHAEAGVLPTCQRHGMGVLVWGPLSGGFLTGKYRRDVDPASSERGSRWATMPGWDRSRPEVQRKLEIVEQLAGVADDAGMSLTHMAIAFTLAHPAVTSTIIGPRTMDQLDDLLAGADLRLGDDVLDAIDEIVPPGATVDPADTGIRLPWVTEPEQRRRSR